MITPKPKIIRELRLLAKQGHATAQYNLGVFYAKGLGVAQDDAEAVKWYRKAAEQGVADAQYNLGLMYHAGESVPRIMCGPICGLTLLPPVFLPERTAIKRSRNAIALPRI